MEPHKPLTSDDAAAIWRRAAHLQAEAAQRMEERSRALSVRESSASQDSDKFSVEEVRAAAAEAGIAPEFIALALTEMSADPIGGLPPRLDDAATKFLGTAERSLELSRRVDLPARQVYEALQKVLPGAPWLLMLRDVSGDPLAGGQLIFDIPTMTATGTLTGYNLLAYYGYAVDVQQVQIMLRPVAESDGSACEILLRAGLQRSVRRNFIFGRWSAGIAGGLGAGAGVGLGLLMFGPGAIVAVPAMAGAALLSGGTAIGYRASYKHYLRKFTALLNDMLSAAAAHARTGGSFALPSAQAGLPAARPTSAGDVTT